MTDTQNIGDVAMSKEDNKPTSGSEAKTRKIELPPTSGISDERGTAKTSYTTQPLETPMALAIQELGTRARTLYETHNEHDVEDFPQLSLLKEMARLLDTVASIQQTPTEDTDFCIGSISELLKEIINTIADELNNFNGHKYCELKFKPTAAAFTDVLLSQHMKRLLNGHYDVVSDLASWRDDQLLQFRSEAEKAVANGAQIRRVFNLMLTEPRYRHLKPGDKAKILREHLSDSESWTEEHPGTYEVRTFGKTELSNLRNKKSTYREHEFGLKTHFGIFYTATEGSTLVEYEVREPDLSLMQLGKSQQALQTHLEIFRDVWDVASPLSESEILRICRPKKRSSGL